MITNIKEAITVMKFSRQRESIRDNLFMRKDHPTADMVYQDIRKIYPNISLGTVYRNLTLLTELGEAQKIVSGDGFVRFDGNPAPHYHFICRTCGAVQDVDITPAKFLEEVAATKFDGVIESHSILFSGLCSSCKGSETVKS